MRMTTTVVDSQANILSTNKVLKNTYLLLSMTLLFSAAMAWMSMSLELPHPGLLITLVGYFGLLFLTARFSNSAWGLLCVFALTGFMGLTLGPMLNILIKQWVNGEQIIVTALSGTGIIVLSLSAYALISRKDFSFMAGFLITGAWIAFFAGLGAYFFDIPALSLAVSAAFILISSGLILFETGQIINGGETNYILATVSLYVSIYNIFVNLLQLLAAFSGDE